MRCLAEAEYQGWGSPAEADKFQQGIMSSDSAVEIEEGDPPVHSFIFLKMGSGTHLMTNMIQRQNHFT